MDLAAKHHQDQAFDKFMLEAMLEVLMITLGRNIPASQLDDELGTSVQTIFDKVNESESRNSTEAELELLGTVKNLIIDVLDKADYSK